MKTIQLVSNRTWGGGERYALDLTRTLLADGEDVEVISKGIKDVDTPFREAGAMLSRLPLGGELDIVSPLMLARRLRRDPSRRILIHVHNFKDASTAIKARALAGECGKEIRILCTRHLVKAGKRTGRARSIYAGLDAIVFVSELAKKEFLNGQPEVDEKKLHVVHNSIIPPVSSDMNGIETDSAMTGEETVNLLFLGRIAPEKGLDTLIRALGMLADLNLRLRIAGVGQGPYVKQLKGEVWLAGVTDRVEWLGHIDDVYGQIRSSDIGVLPTHARESFGLVLLEFMSQGKPLVSTDNGAQPEIITSGEEGLLVAPDNPEAMAAALRRLAESPELRKEMGERGRAAFEQRFSYPAFMRHMKAIRESLFS